jgi:hypothetical protein
MNYLVVTWVPVETTGNIQEFLMGSVQHTFPIVSGLKSTCTYVTSNNGVRCNNIDSLISSYRISGKFVLSTSAQGNLGCGKVQIQTGNPITDIGTTPTVTIGVKNNMEYIDSTDGAVPAVAAVGATKGKHGSLIVADINYNNFFLIYCWINRSRL